MIFVGKDVFFLQHGLAMTEPRPRWGASGRNDEKGGPKVLGGRPPCQVKNSHFMNKIGVTGKWRYGDSRHFLGSFKHFIRLFMGTMCCIL